MTIINGCKIATPFYCDIQPSRKLWESVLYKKAAFYSSKMENANLKQNTKVRSF